MAARAHSIENRRSRVRGVVDFYFLQHLCSESVTFGRERAALQPQRRFLVLKNRASHCSLGRSGPKVSFPRLGCCKKFLFAAPQAREAHFYRGTTVAAAWGLFLRRAKMAAGRSLGAAPNNFDFFRFWCPGTTELDSGVLPPPGLDSSVLAPPGQNSNVLAPPGLDSSLLAS